MNRTRLNKQIVSGLAAFVLSLSFVASVRTQTAQTTPQYPAGPDSKLQPGVPKGEVLKFSFDHSEIFPGTYRDYWVYVPAQYTPDKPACVYVDQDGVQFEGPTVLDNLIYKKEIPVTIAVFVMHGRVRAADAGAALDRFNRSYEYDGLGDSYVRFLLEELLPEVETKKTSDGRPIRLSHNGNDRAIGGSSSGAICAFTAAWERPDAFTRVFSSIGTYVGLRGGDRYSTLIRRYEPKPIRIFLQDGSNDLNIYGGDWWMANQTMERALEFAGYEVQHVWGEGAHNGNHATAVFPDAMRWLWKDWPQPVKPGQSKNGTLADILIQGEGWNPVPGDYKDVTGPAVNAKGDVFFGDALTGHTNQLTADGHVNVFLSDFKKSAFAFGPDEQLYAMSANQKITAYDSAGRATRFSDGVAGSAIIVAHNGNAYVAAPSWNTGPDSDTNAGGNVRGEAISKIWLIKADGKKQAVDNGLGYAKGIALSPDQTLLYLNDASSHWVYSFQIQPDGSLAFGQRYYWLQVPDDADDSGAGGMCVDREGRLYVATRLGIQVCDQAGRVNCIIPTPNGKVTGLCFGGRNFDTLYAACGDKIFGRKLKAVGANAWEAPLKPPAPKL
jgi:gluconolactonase